MSYLISDQNTRCIDAKYITLKYCKYDVNCNKTSKKLRRCIKTVCHKYEILHLKRLKMMEWLSRAHKVITIAAIR